MLYFNLKLIAFLNFSPLLGKATLKTQLVLLIECLDFVRQIPSSLKEAHLIYAKLWDMTRFETMGRIIGYLHSLKDTSLEELLAELSNDITDETIEVITHDKDDTEHLQSSAVNAEDLDKAVKEMKGHKLLTPQHAA